MGFSPLIRISSRGGSAAKTLLFSSSSSPSSYLGITRSSYTLVGQTQTLIQTSNSESDNQSSSSSSSRRWFHSSGDGLPSYMRAAVFREPNKPLSLEEFHIPRPKSGEILVKTKGLSLPPYPFFFPLFLWSSTIFAILSLDNTWENFRLSKSVFLLGGL